MNLRKGLIFLGVIMIAGVGIVFLPESENSKAIVSDSQVSPSDSENAASRDRDSFELLDADHGGLSLELDEILESELPEAESYYIPPQPLTVGRELMVPPDFRITRGSAMGKQVYLSPTGDGIALVDWVREGDAEEVTYRIHLSNPDTGEWETIRTQSSEEGSLRELIWNADGSGVIFQSIDANGLADIYRYDRESRTTKPIASGLNGGGMLLGASGESDESIIVASINAAKGLTIRSISAGSTEPEVLQMLDALDSSRDGTAGRSLNYLTSTLRLRPHANELYCLAYEWAENSGGGVETTASYLYRVVLNGEATQWVEVDLSPDFSGIIDSVQWNAKGDLMGISYRKSVASGDFRSTYLDVVDADGKTFISRKLHERQMVPLLAISDEEVVVAATPRNLGPIPRSEYRNARLGTPYFIPFSDLK